MLMWFENAVLGIYELNYINPRGEICGAHPIAVVYPKSCRWYYCGVLVDAYIHPFYGWAASAKDAIAQVEAILLEREAMIQWTLESGIIG